MEMEKIQKQRMQTLQSAFAVYNTKSAKKSKKKDNPTNALPKSDASNNPKKKISRKDLLAQLENGSNSSSLPTVHQDLPKENGTSLKKKQEKKKQPSLQQNGVSGFEKIEVIPQPVQNLKVQNSNKKVLANCKENDDTQVETPKKHSLKRKCDDNLQSGSVSKKKLSKSIAMPIPQGNSEEDGQRLFEWLLQPYSLKKFFDKNWEKQPLLLKRKTPTYADGIFTTADFNEILKENNVRFDVNLDVTTYQNGVRETHNVEGRAFPSVVWDYYNNGCSIRLKNPQSFSTPVWKLCSTLQEYFKSMVGANVYLTPAGTQGFAPHYDDIEAFVLQLEGKKRWSVYNPKNEDETLPRYSSKNFTDVEIGEEILTTTLNPGDLLYFPRGFIHQAHSLPDEHSLHITISTYQKNSWADFLEKLVPDALTKAINEDVSFRKGLPRDYLSYLGVQNSDKTDSRRKEILNEVSSLVRRLADYMDADQVADTLGASFLHDVLPPVLSEDEKSRCVVGADVTLTSPGKPSACLGDIDVETKICVVRKNAMRICVDIDEEANDDSIRVHHCVQNPRVYHEEEKKFFILASDYGSALEYLIDSYPKYVTVEELPLEDDNDKAKSE